MVSAVLALLALFSGTDQRHREDSYWPAMTLMLTIRDGLTAGRLNGNAEPV